MEYIPTTTPRGKWITEVTSRSDNGGIHDQKKFKSAVEMLEHASNNWRSPKLCHICFTGSDKETYSKIITRLVRSLNKLNVRHDYKSATEQDNTFKGEHLHLMLVLENMDDGPNPFNLIDSKPESILSQAVAYYADTHNVKFNICISRTSGGRFLPVSKTNQAKFNDAVDWMSYIYKARSKSLVKGRIYSSSRDRQPKKPHTLH